MIDCMGEGDQNANEGDIHNSKGRNIDEETIVSTGEIQQMSKLLHAYTWRASVINPLKTGHPEHLSYFV